MWSQESHTNTIAEHFSKKIFYLLQYIENNMLFRTLLERTTFKFHLLNVSCYYKENHLKCTKNI